MTKVSIDSIPFVDGIPGENQSRINWIKNMEPLNGASTTLGNDGQLNRSGVQIQSNVISVHNNTLKLSDAANQLNNDVQQIKDSLSIIGDNNAIEQVYKNKSDITELKEHNVSISNDVGQLKVSSDSLKTEVGTYDPVRDPYYRNIRDNIIWIKKELGAYPGQDFNGQPAQESQGSGVKYRIIANSDLLNKQETRLRKLEKDFSDSDVGTLNNSLNELRTEVGPHSLSNGTSLYVRLNKDESDINEMNLSISNIEKAIDFSNSKTLSSRVSYNESKLTEIDADINSPNNGILYRLNNIDAEIGNETVPSSIKGTLHSLSDDIKYMSDIVGKDSSSGLQGQVAWINQKVGIVESGQPLPTGSILSRLDIMSGIQNDQMSSIQDIQSEIGNNDEGLKGSVVQLMGVMYGNGTSESPIEKNGVYSTVESLNFNAVIDVEDTTTYVRTKDQWVKKTMAIAKFTGNSVAVNLKDSSLVKFTPSSLVSSDYNSRIRVINNDIIIDEEAIYDINIRSLIAKENADLNLGVAIYVNDVESHSCNYGFKTVGGQQLIDLVHTISVSPGSRITIFVKALDDKAKVAINVDDVVIDIRPSL